MVRQAFCLLVAFGAVVTIGRCGDAQELSAERVRQSIDRGVRFLKSRQDTRTGHWRRLVQFPGGVSGLCTLALLNAGVPADDRSIRQAIAYLDSLQIDDLSVYTVSLMTMVYAAADPDRHRPRIRQCVDYLVRNQVVREQAVEDPQNPGLTRIMVLGDSGGWAYPWSGRADASNSQFALLALHEASLVGVQVDRAVWLRAKRYWDIVWKEETGGFFYTASRDRGPTGSMTCAGISSIIIISENLQDASNAIVDGRVVCCGAEDWLVQVDRASDWMAQHFTVRKNPSEMLSRGQNFYYYLYGMERAGRLSGERFFGEHDWYREGAEFLTNIQRGDGSWEGNPTHAEDMPEIATSFALLFLAKGRRPIAIGKYRHGDGIDWDRNSKGVHYLTRSLEDDWRMKLNWQTINGAVASTDDLLEAPVLFISGRDSLQLSDEQKQRLKEYVEYGGFIFAEACQGDGCGDQSAFDRQFRELMSQLFPSSQLRAIEPNHPIWTAQYRLQPNPQRPLLGLQSSCRTSVVYCPANLSCFWQLNRPATLPSLAEPARTDIEYCTQLGANVLAYATGRDLKDKLERPQIVDATDASGGDRVLTIPKLTHGGGADEAPNAWQNVLRRARFDFQQPIKLERKLIPVDELNLANHPMVFMHGRYAFEFSPQEQEALRQYLERGGFLLVDTICAAEPFANSFRQQMAEIFPQHPLSAIEATHPIWTEQFGGYDVRQVTLRRPVRGGDAGDVQRTTTPPKMESLEIDGRIAVIFSPYDLSCALENASASQCEGYSRDDASKIGVNLILFALRQ